MKVIMYELSPIECMITIVIKDSPTCTVGEIPIKEISSRNEELERGGLMQ